MPRDYAKHRVIQPTAKKGHSRLGQVLLGVLAVLLLGGGFWFYQHKTELLTASSDSFFSKMKTLLSHKKPPAKKGVLITEAPPEPVHFEFYEALPNMQVSPSAPVTAGHVAAPAPVKAEPKPVETPNKSTSEYVVQLGLFKDNSSASQIRLSFLLSGLETEVVKVTENGEELYRVQQGPFSTMPEAKAAQKQLQRKGIDSVIKSPS